MSIYRTLDTTLSLREVLSVLCTVSLAVNSIAAAVAFPESPTTTTRPFTSYTYSLPVSHPVV